MNFGRFLRRYENFDKVSMRVARFLGGISKKVVKFLKKMERFKEKSVGVVQSQSLLSTLDGKCLFAKISSLLHFDASLQA